MRDPNLIGLRLRALDAGSWDKLPAKCILKIMVSSKDVDKLIQKFLWRGKRPRIVNTIFKQKNKSYSTGTTDFKTFCKAIV